MVGEKGGNGGVAFVFHGTVLHNRSQRPLKPFTIFVIFIKHCCYRAYEIDIFVELADNGLSCCRRVVLIN